MRGSSPTLESGPQSVRRPLDSPATASQIGGRSPSGVTTQATIASVRPADESERTRTSPGVVKKAPEKKRSRALPLVLALGIAAVVLGTVGLLDGSRHEAATPAATVAATPVETAPLPPATSSHFTVRVESTPAGADVREGDRVLGTTPIELSIDKEAARATPRSFTLVKDGFVPYPIVQGPSDETVRIIAPLALLPAAAVSSVAAHAGPPLGPAHHAGTHPPIQATPPAPSASNPDLDIRMTR
jgi:serine/threonine-protein kinase